MGLISQAILAAFGIYLSTPIKKIRVLETKQWVMHSLSDSDDFVNVLSLKSDALQ